VDQTLSELIATLPEEERVVLTLHYLRQLSIAEIAGAIGVPERSINAVLASGRTKLSSALNIQSQFPLG
jgi:RNA polymerase sigma factor (sigma-70 family)